MHLRTWQTAHKMKGPARRAAWRHGQERQLPRPPLHRQYTINPAITHGISHVVRIHRAG